MATLLRIVERVDTLLVTLARWFGYVSALAIALLVVLLVASTLQRYVLLRPIAVTEELGGLLFLGLGFLSLGYGFVENRHVRLSLLWRNLPYPWKQILEVFGYLLALVGLYVLIRETYALWHFSFLLMERSEVTEIVLWPWRAVIPLCLGMLAVLIALRAVVVSLKLALGEKPPEADTVF